jgi:hypothetical protein
MWACGYEVGSDTGANGATSLFEPDSLGVNPRSLDFRLPRFLSIEGASHFGWPLLAGSLQPAVGAHVGVWACGSVDVKTLGHVGM